MAAHISFCWMHGRTHIVFFPPLNILRDVSMSTIDVSKGDGQVRWSHHLRSLSSRHDAGTWNQTRRLTRGQRRMFTALTVPWLWGASRDQPRSSLAYISCLSHFSEVKGRGSCQGTGRTRPIFRRRCGWLNSCSWLISGLLRGAVAELSLWQFWLMCQMTPVLGEFFLRKEGPGECAKRFSYGPKCRPPKLGPWTQLFLTVHWQKSHNFTPENLLLIHPFYGWGNWGPESWNNFLKVSQLLVTKWSFKARFPGFKTFLSITLSPSLPVRRINILDKGLCIWLHRLCTAHLQLVAFT